jgi:hypothetical protein
MKMSTTSARGVLLRETLVFQLKLLADGARDLVLVPLSIVATLVGLVRGGDHPDLEFRRVIELGRQSEQWINLFGEHEPIHQAGSAGSIDMLLSKAEQVVREQARQGGITESASRAITRALDAAQRTAARGGADRKRGKGARKPPDQ